MTSSQYHLLRQDKDIRLSSVDKQTDLPHTREEKDLK